MRGFVLLLVALVLALPAGAQAAPSWLAPVTLDGPTPDVPSDVRTAVAMNERGDTVVAWGDYLTQGDTNPANDQTQMVVAYRPAGGGFGPPQILQAPTGGAFTPDARAGVAGDGSAIVAFTTPNSPTSNRVQVASSGSAGTFAPARDVTGALADSATLEDMDVNEAGAVTILYRQADKLVGAVGTVAGDIGPLPPLVTNAYPNTGRTAIDAAGDVVFAWERDLTDRYLVEVRDKPAGQPLKPTVTVSSDAADARAEGPSLATGADGRAVVAYGFRDGGTTEVVRYNARSAPAGSWASGTWNPVPGLVSGPGQTTASYGTGLGILPDNTAIATFTAVDNSVWAASRLSGQQFASHQALSESNAGSYNQKLAVSGDGSAVVVFQGGQTIQAARRDPGAATFGPTKEDVDQLGGPGYTTDAYTGSDTPVAADAHGNAITAYSVFRCPTGCTKYESLVRFVLLDGEAPRLGDVTIPATGVTAAPLSFSAGALDVASAFTTSWAFGDGQTATGGSVTHAYGAPGAFTATVTTTDAVGNASSRSGTVQVTAAPAATATPTSSPGPPAKLATTVRARFSAKKRYAKVLELTLRKVPAGVTARIGCTGEGCPFKKGKTLKFPKAAASRAVAQLFTRKVRRKRRAVKLKVGAKVTVEVFSPTAIGRRYTFTVRRKKVGRAATCLAAGSRRAVTC